jgi:hypothetical protein
MECGKGLCPPGPAKARLWNTECLIKVIASSDIPAGAELLTNYGPGFWASGKK